MVGVLTHVAYPNSVEAAANPAILTGPGGQWLSQSQTNRLMMGTAADQAVMGRPVGENVFNVAPTSFEQDSNPHRSSDNSIEMADRPPGTINTSPANLYPAPPVVQVTGNVVDMPNQSERDNRVAQLVEMGFMIRDARRELERSNWDVSQAAANLSQAGTMRF